MLKKWVFTLFMLCLLCLPFAAAGEGADISLSPGKEFLVYREKPQAVAEICHLTKEQLDSLFQNQHTVYLAVNSENTKQIRAMVDQTGFSENIGNLSALSNEKITALLPDLTGGTHGEVVTKGGQKFIKEQLRTADSGNDYVLTRYTTVAGKKMYLLMFYTAAGTATDYTEEVFQTYASPDFEPEAATENHTAYRVIVPFAMLLLCAVAVFLIYTLLRDLKKPQQDD